MLLNDSERQRQIELFVDSLTVEEARAAYGMIARRLSALAHIQETAALQRFSVGQRVAFFARGSHIEGVVVRINLRTISVMTDDSQRWTVSPKYLVKVNPQASPRDQLQHRSRTKRTNKHNKNSAS